MRGSRRILVLAFILGGIAAVLSWRIVQDKSQAPLPTARVLVAAQDIAMRTRVTKSMVREEEIPASAKHPEALSSLQQVDGQVTRLPLTSGEQILLNKLTAARDESGLSFIIPPTKRAVAIQTNEVIGAGGLVLPGDRVDVIAVFDAKTMEKDMATIVLQDIEVIAVAQKLEGELGTKSPLDQAGEMLDRRQAEAPKLPQTSPQPQPTAKTVTLAVSPEEAQRLVLADAYGKIRLALRPNREKTVVDLPEATLSTLRIPLQQGVAQVTALTMTPTTLLAGDLMKVELTVKNVSTTTVKSQGPEPGFIYLQGQTFQTVNFPSQAGGFRVGLNFDGERSVDFPYRWGLGGDLDPGASTTVVGYIKFNSSATATDFWAGVIDEQTNLVRDNVGPIKVTVVPANRG